MFWLKYDDVKDDLNEFEKNHPKHNIGLAIWDNYLKN